MKGDQVPGSQEITPTEKTGATFATAQSTTDDVTEPPGGGDVQTARDADNNNAKAKPALGTVEFDEIWDDSPETLS